MQTLARLIVNVVDMAEAEGRLFRRELVRGVVTVGLAISTVILSMLGLLFMIYSLFGFLEHTMGRDLAALVAGGAWLLSAWFISRIVKARVT